MSSLLAKTMSGKRTATASVGDTYSNSDHNEELLNFSSESRKHFKIINRTGRFMQNGNLLNWDLPERQTESTLQCQ